MDWKKAYGKKNEGGSSGGGYGSSFVGKRDAPPSYGSSFVGKRDAPKSVPPSSSSAQSTFGTVGRNSNKLDKKATTPRPPQGAPPLNNDYYYDNSNNNNLRLYNTTTE